MNLFATQAIMREVLDRAVASGMPHLPALTWAASGNGVVVFITAPTAAWPRRIIRRAANHPTLVIVGADMGADLDAAPTEWRCVPDLANWARTVMVHAAAGAPDHYRTACWLAEAHRRAVVVECTPRTAAAWNDAIRCPRTHLIWPTNGQHPVIPGVTH